MWSLTLEKMVQIGLLFDFYGQLLTKKQREMVDLYYQQDLSLSEIASQTGVSRQAVHDLIKRASESLVKYEAKLGLAGRYRQQRVRLGQALGRLDEAIETLNSKESDVMAAVKLEIARPPFEEARKILAGLLDD